MNDYLKIPFTLTRNKEGEALEKIPVEDSIREFINLLITTKQGECIFDPDFGYELWSNEFEPILNIQQWQPKFIEQIKTLLEKYEQRITAIQVNEPEIKAIPLSTKTDRSHKITISLDYTIRSTAERQNGVKISFEY